MRETESTPLSRWVDEVAAVVASLLVAAVGIAVLVRRYHRVLSHCIRPSDHLSDGPTFYPNDQPTDRQSDRPIDHPSGHPTDRPSDQLPDEAAVSNPFPHPPTPPSEDQVVEEMRDMAQRRVRHIVLQSPIFDDGDLSLFSV